MATAEEAAHPAPQMTAHTLARVCTTAAVRVGCLHSLVVGLNDMLLAHSAELTAGVTSTAAAMGTNAIAMTPTRR